MNTSLNIARRLAEIAQARPDAAAVVEPLGYDAAGKRRYRHFTFRQLDDDSDRIAGGLRRMGVPVGARLALLVRPGIDFISLVLALFKAGTVSILIDPGMGRRSLIKCLADAEPDGFVAIPIVHAVRTLLSNRFPKARFNVTVGCRWFWGDPTLDQLRREPSNPLDLPPCSADQPAAIIFTTGSTGPPKGVLYTHGNFDAQVDQIRDFYGIQPGEVDLPCFPLFGLFNCVMGVTAVIPDMDPSRPARVDPTKIIEAVRDWRVTQAFGSPAIWDRVGRYCEERGIRLETVRRVLSAGAPVPIDVLRRMKDCIHPDGDVHTPYGATEALPVASNCASAVLGMTGATAGSSSSVHSSVVGCVERSEAPPEQGTVARGGTSLRSPHPTRLAAVPHWQSPWRTSGPHPNPLPKGEETEGTAARTRAGGGVCVGHKFSGVRWKVIRIVDGSISSIAEAEGLPPGEIGELVVAGPQVTRVYVTRVESNALAKIPDADDSFWHRMGDSGYFDDLGRFWFCGRVAHRVETADGPLYPICCEAIFNCHPAIRRSALVGVGPKGRQRPVIILEPHRGQMPRGAGAREMLLTAILALGAANPLTAGIHDFLLHPAFPVDIRHNVKIFREKLAVWAASQRGIIEE